jgi:hypothetical protein
MLVAHGKRHHALIKASLAKKGLGMPVDQGKDFFAAPLDFALKRTHGAQKLPLRLALGKEEAAFMILTRGNIQIWSAIRIKIKPKENEHEIHGETAGKGRGGVYFALAPRNSDSDSINYFSPPGLHLRVREQVEVICLAALLRAKAQRDNRQAILF